jgi:hypothetical protein
MTLKLRSTSASPWVFFCVALAAGKLAYWSIAGLRDLTIATQAG